MIQIYTGDGKGKTTAAVGLAVRASAHHKVLFVQLIKKGDSSEVNALKELPNVDYRAFGSGEWVFKGKGKTKERENCKKALEYIKEKIKDYDVVIVDEVVTAIKLGVLDEKSVLDIIIGLPKDKELILTGRGASDGLIQAADLVTEMKKVKHYYDMGVKARKGIEK